MKTVVVIGLVLLVLSIVMPALAQNEIVPDNGASQMSGSGSSDDTKPDESDKNVRGKRAACRWSFVWRVQGRSNRSTAQINRFLRAYFRNVVCR